MIETSGRQERQMEGVRLICLPMPFHLGFPSGKQKLVSINARLHTFCWISWQVSHRPLKISELPVRIRILCPRLFLLLEDRGNGWSPDRECLRSCLHSCDWFMVIDQTAISIVFHHEAAGVKPIVKDLIAQDVLLTVS